MTARAGLWALSVFVTLIAVAALFGAKAVVVGGALWVLWLGLALFLLRRQSLLREAVDQAASGLSACFQYSSTGLDCCRYSAFCTGDSAGS